MKVSPSSIEFSSKNATRAHEGHGRTPRFGLSAVHRRDEFLLYDCNEVLQSVTNRIMSTAKKRRASHAEARRSTVTGVCVVPYAQASM
jgi:hypothetical protein